MLRLFVYIYRIALVAELVDALDSKSSSLGSAGSIPAPGTESLVQKNGALLLPEVDSLLILESSQIAPSTRST